MYASVLDSQQHERYTMIKDMEVQRFTVYFYLYIYPPDSKESDRGAIHRVSNYPDLLPEMLPIRPIIVLSWLENVD